MAFGEWVMVDGKWQSVIGTEVELNRPTGIDLVAKEFEAMKPITDEDRERILSESAEAAKQAMESINAFRAESTGLSTPISDEEIEGIAAYIKERYPFPLDDPTVTSATRAAMAETIRQNEIADGQANAKLLGKPVPCRLSTGEVVTINPDGTVIEPVVTPPVYWPVLALPFYIIQGAVIQSVDAGRGVLIEDAVLGATYLKVRPIPDRYTSFSGPNFKIEADGRVVELVEAERKTFKPPNVPVGFPRGSFPILVDDFEGAVAKPPKKESTAQAQRRIRELEAALAKEKKKLAGQPEIELPPVVRPRARRLAKLDEEV